MASEVRVLTEGEAEGPALVLEEPLSFWGGLDPETGTVIDRHHPQRGSTVTGTVLVMPSGRGSSSSSTVLAEAIRLGTGPLGVIMREPDPIVMLGSLVAEELYRLACPVLVVPSSIYDTIRTNDHIVIEHNGTVRLG